MRNASWLSWWLLAALAAGVAAPAAAQTDARLEAALLAEDWAQVAAAAERAAVPSAVLRLIRGHAYLALNRNNDSLCQFLSVSAPADLKAWAEWAENFAARHAGSAVAYYLSGDARARLQQWTEALAAFERSLQLRPNHALVLNARGVTYAAQQRWAEASVDLEDATRANPSLADAHASRGALNIQRSTGAPGALEALNLALKASPRFVLALNGRAAVRTVLRDWDAAQADLREARRQAPACLDEVVAGVLGPNAETLADARTRAVHPELAELAQLPPGTEIGRTSQGIRDYVGQHTRNMSPNEIANLKGAIPQMNRWSNFRAAMQPNARIDSSSVQAHLSGKVIGAGPAVAYGASGGISAQRSSTEIRTPKLDSLNDIAFRNKISTALNELYPNIKANSVGLLGGFNMGNRYPDLTKPNYGGVRTARLAAAGVDQGQWPAVTLYGLFYSAQAGSAAGGK